MSLQHGSIVQSSSGCFLSPPGPHMLGLLARQQHELLPRLPVALADQADSRLHGGLDLARRKHLQHRQQLLGRALAGQDGLAVLAPLQHVQHREQAHGAAAELDLPEGPLVLLDGCDRDVVCHG